MSKEEKNSKKARDDKKIDGLMGKIHFAQNAYLDGYEGSTEDFCKLFHYLIRDGRGDELTWHASNNTCRNKLCAGYEEEAFKDLPFKLVPVDIEKRKKEREKEKEDENSRA